MKLTPKERTALREMFGGKCAYCGCELPAKWHADHIDPVIRQFRYVFSESRRSYVARATGVLYAPENDRKDNFFPACIPCNIDKSSMSIESWRSGLQQRVRVLRDNYSAFRHAERFGLVEVKEIAIVFWFEKFTVQAVTNQEVSQ